MQQNNSRITKLQQHYTDQESYFKNILTNKAILSTYRPTKLHQHNIEQHNHNKI